MMFPHEMLGCVIRTFKCNTYVSYGNIIHLYNIYYLYNTICIYTINTTNTYIYKD